MKKWKKFENSTAKVVKEFNPNSDVQQNVRIQGKLSKESREVDLILVEPNQYDFLVFECKDKKRSIDTPVVESFVTKLKDLGVKKGAIVSNSPYTKGAKNMAKAFSIDLLHLVDDSDKDIRTQLYMMGVITISSLEGFNIGFKGTSDTFNGAFYDDVEKLKLVSPNGQVSIAKELFYRLWNEDKLLNEKPGQYQYAFPNDKGFGVLNTDDIKNAVKDLSFYYEVVQKIFFGKVMVIDTNGIYDIKKMTYRTKSLKTEVIKPRKILKEWQEVSSREDLPKDIHLEMKLTSFLD